MVGMCDGLGVEGQSAGRDGLAGSNSHRGFAVTGEG